jgi:hypothetical protein
VGLRAGLDTVEKSKISFPCRESNSGRPDCSPSLHRLRYIYFYSVVVYLMTLSVAHIIVLIVPNGWNISE